MPYQFTDSTNQQLQSAFSNARVVRENSVNGATRNWDFIFIKLEKPQPLAGLPDSKDDIVQTIFNGDGAIKDDYAKKIFTELDQDARTAFLSALHSQDARTPAHQFFAGLTTKNKHENTRNLMETIFEFASNQVRSAQPPI